MPGRAARRALAAGRVAGPALLAGLLLAFSVPPFGFWPLAFLGAGLLYLELAGRSLGGRLLLGWLAGLGLFAPGLFWARAFNWYGAVVLIIVEALSTALAAALVPPMRGRLAAYAGAFTLLEALRMAWPFGGLPLGGVSLGQAQGPLLAAARLGGPLLLTGLVFLGGAALAELAVAGLRWRARTDRIRLPGRWCQVRGRAAGLVGAILVVLIGLMALPAPDGGPARASLVVAAVQGGGRRGVSQAEVAPATVFRAQLAATARLEALEAREAAGGRRPTLVVWPEDVIALAQPLGRSPAEAIMAGLARRLRATLLAGVTVILSDREFSNQVVAWGPAGRLVGSFEKVHRVPFGEYVPFRGFFSHLADLSGVPRDAVPGRGSGLLRTPAGPLGLMVSFEVFFSERARSSVRAGARVLVVPTNTSSYATGQVPAQEMAADRLRAVEEGRDLVQAAPTGFSLLVDHDGTVRARSGLGNPALVLGRLHLRDGLTLYGRFGDLPVLILAGLGVLAGWARATRSSRNGCRRRGSPRPRTWRGWPGRPRGPGAGRSRSPGAGGPRCA